MKRHKLKQSLLENSPVLLITKAIPSITSMKELKLYCYFHVKETYLSIGFRGKYRENLAQFGKNG